MAGMFHLEDGAFARLLNGRVLLAATDAATTLTAAQSIGSIVTMTPTAGRAVTTPIGADIIAELSEFRVGSVFEVTIVNLASATHAITFTAGASNVTVTGLATVAAATSATFIGRIATATTVIYYRK